MDASPDPHSATDHSATNILLTGGGSGGHITPILAVAHELKRLRPELSIFYVGQKGEKLSDVISRSPDIDGAAYVWAGKWRRYHGEGWRQLLDLPTMIKNVRDVFRVIRGTFQSYRLLKRYKPAGIFIKGGFVGVPVGIAAHWRHIPFVTHDSDAVPGLANRIVGRWAVAHAVGMPAELYSYMPSKTFYVGVPIAAEYQPATPQIKQQAKQEIGLGGYEQVLLVTGGGLGAQRVNEAVLGVVPSLLKSHPKLAVVHGVGPDHERTMTAAYQAVLEPADTSRVIVQGYLHDMHRYATAADVIITRAGATNLAEWAALAKACIVIPNPLLTGGHQLKNTQALVEREAIVQINEADLTDKQLLRQAIEGLLNDPTKRAKLESQIAQFAKPKAASELAQLLLKSFGIEQGREAS